MKAKRMLVLMSLLTIVVGNALADGLTVSDFSITAGETKTISIELNNPTKDYIAFEFWMRLPDGVRIVYDEDDYLMAELNTARANRHELVVNEPEKDGVYHFLCYSNRNTIFKEKSGEIVSLTVCCADDASGGNYAGAVYDVMFSDPNKVEVNFDDFTFDVAIDARTLPGDANGDGSVTIADVVVVVSYLLNQPSENFVFSNADVDGGGEVTIDDALAIVDIILEHNGNNN